MRPHYDLAVVGSGFGGSLLALIGRRLGLSVLLLERGKHPRFSIGESTSPLANLLIEEMAHRYNLPRLLPLTSYGLWKREYPEIGVGLKRGFTYYAHTTERPFTRRPDRSDQLLVAASPNEETADTHWFRADVDHFLVQEAQNAGTDYFDIASVHNVEGLDSGGGVTVTGERNRVAFCTRAAFLVDATGPRGLLSRTLNLPELEFARYPGTQSLFSHFTGVRRADTIDVFATPGTPPYAPDDAALHHVFGGGWMWVLRFDNGITSAGISVTDALAADLNLSEGAPAWQRFMARFPSVAAQFAEAQPTRPFVYAPRLSYRCGRSAGENWALLPSASAFVDPLFSTGIPLTLLGIERLSAIFAQHWGTSVLPERLRAYERVTLDEADNTACFIGGCFSALGRFSHFASYAMFYFAAASYSEMARRLQKPHLVRRFLAADHPTFAPAMAACASHLRAEKSGRPQDAAAFAARVACGIEPINVAGLCDPAKGNWYPADLADVVRAAPKLEYTEKDLRAVLAAAPWAAGCAL